MTTNITTLPYDCTSAGETYQFTGNLTSASGIAITISAANVVIDGAGYTLNFAQTSTGTGIIINDSNAEIKNLTFRSAYTAQPNYNDIRHIDANGATSPYIHGCTFHLWAREVTTLDGDGNGITENDHGIYGLCTNSGTITKNVFNLTGSGRGYTINLTGPWLVSYNTFTAKDYTMVSYGGTPYAVMIGFGGVTAITFEYNDVIVESTADNVYGIGGWTSSNHIVRKNRITYNGQYGRIIAPDHDSESWTIEDNIITVGSPVSTGAIYGIRYRNGNDVNGSCGGKHIIQYNTIDCSGHGGSDPCYGISAGGYSPGIEDCPQVKIRYNDIKAKDGAIEFYINDGGFRNVYLNDIYCNKIESTATSGYPIRFDGSSTSVDDIVFSNNLITTAHTSGYEVYVNWDASSVVTFCNCGTINVGGGGSVGSASEPCQDGSSSCYSTAGSRYNGPWGATYESSTGEPGTVAGGAGIRAVSGGMGMRIP